MRGFEEVLGFAKILYRVFRDRKTKLNQRAFLFALLSVVQWEKRSSKGKIIEPRKAFF
jgi:hypothetical protein